MTSRELLRLEILDDDDLPGLRHLAGRAAGSLGFDSADITRIATSVSELARLAQQQLPATLQIRVDTARGAPTAMTIVFAFALELPAELAPGGPIHNVVARLMDRTELAAAEIVISKTLPDGVDDARVEQARDNLLLEPPGDLRAVLQSQNEDLIAALITLRERESELIRVNAELDATNRGVVALYAELEQRAGEVRHAQRLVFEELEAALRPPPPAVPGLQLDVRYVPAQSNSPTGGDLYDWFLLPSGALHVTVVDVQGHGVASTRDALRVTHAIRTLALEGHPLGSLLTRADTLLRTSGDDLAATVLLARIDPATGRVELAGAGHPPALRIPASSGKRSAGKSPDYVEAPGHPLGYEQAGASQVTTIDLHRDETLLLYTDGLIEVRRDLIEGMATLVTAAGKAADLLLPQQLDTVLAACAQGDSLTDDTLLLGLKWTGVG